MPASERLAQAPRQRIAAAIAAACLVCLPLTAVSEGLMTKPYRDPGNPKLWTVCYGETEREMRTYTKAECQALLRVRQARDYAPKVLDCVPAFVDPKRVHAFAASIDAAYNAGTAAFCRSRMAKAFNRGDWKAGCEGFSGWYVTAHGKKLRGLVIRRDAEKALCLKSL